MSLSQSVIIHNTLHSRSIRLFLRCLSAALGGFMSTCVPVSAAPLIDTADMDSLAFVIDRLGPDRPATGRSSFDALFTINRNDEWVYDVPYPFSDVLDRLDYAVGIRGADEKSSLKSALIPFSRCLNRNLTDPDQLVSPRMVVAVDTEPSVVPEERPVFIKNRVFLGHQPKADTIEVISFNEHAGRFEFQVVSNYREGEVPKVEYAKRALCMSCHQSGGPIFSSAPWGETSSNREIANELRRHHASGMDRLIYPIIRLDRATGETRLFEAYQTLWKTMCEGGSRDESIRCRAGLLELMLEKRLVRTRGAFTDSPMVSQFFLPVAGVSFIERWPDGILVPSADVPSRRALRLDPPTTVRPQTDPLRPRPTRLALTFNEIGRLIEGLAGHMPLIDIKALDDDLYETDPGGVRWRFRGSCEMVSQDREKDRGLVGMECQVSDRSLHRRFNLFGDLSIRNESVVAKENFNRWMVGDGMSFIDVYHEGSPIAIDGDYWKIDLRLSAGENRLHVWLADGAAVESVVIRWPREQGAQTPLPLPSSFSADAVMTLRPGYERITTAIARMVERADAGEIDVFDDGGFHGGRVIQALLDELGVRSTPWCCDEWSAMPPLVTTESLASTSADDPRARFNQCCAECHALPMISPTSFLSGPDQVVEKKLSESADRIYYRLGMWDTDKNLREKTPMPPMLYVLHLEDLIPTEQLRVDLKDMRDYSATLLQRNPDDIMNNGYENTAACGPF